MDRNANSAVDSREKYVNSWNELMLEIWHEQIFRLRAIDTGTLYRSLLKFPVASDGRFLDLSLTHAFTEYGLWVDLGVGREVAKGNPGDIGRDKVRQRKRWMSRKYYSSVMAIKDFMAESMGDEFKAIFAEAFDADSLRAGTEHYRRMGY